MNNETKKVGFFEEAPGHRSSMRLFSFVVLVVFVVINFLHFAYNKDIDYNFITYDMMLLVGIFTPKYLQKFAENKSK